MKQKLKQHKKWIWVAAIVLVIVLLALLLFSGGSARSIDTGVQTATVERGDIETSVVGSGTLAFDSASSIKLPTDLVIDEVLVEAGEYVYAGDALAKANYSSLLENLEALRDELGSLNRELDSASNSAKTEYVTSYVTGRIKAVYAEKGDDVAEIINTQGALLVISVDGKMAVDLPAGADVALGEEVSVTLADGSEKTGTVEAVTSGGVKVTLADNGPKLGETVSVKNQAGTTLGAGALYINQPLVVLGSGGTVSSVYVEENQYVYSGATLVVLSDAPVSAEYQKLAAERAEVADALNMLVVAANSNGILRAPFNGTIQSVELGDAGSTDNSAAAADSASGAGVNIYDYISYEQPPRQNQAVFLSAEQELTEITQQDLALLNLIAPETGAAPTTKLSLQAYSAEIIWLPADAMFQADTVYMASYMLTANEGYAFPATFQPSIDGAAVTDVVVGTNADGYSTLRFKAQYAKTGSAADGGGNGGGSTGGLGDINYDEILGSLSSSLSGYDAASAYSAGAYSASSLTTESELLSVAFQIATDQDDMVLSIYVDELDILSIEKGQDATMTFDALNGSYNGSISRISNIASSSGGVAKYKVDVKVERDSSMRAGMNATATIEIGLAEDVLTIPVSALQEVGGRVFVYTQMDENTGELLGEAEVVTGVSNGVSVEIVSGLAEGDTVYYTENIANDMFSMMFGGAGGRG